MRRIFILAFAFGLIAGLAGAQTIPTVENVANARAQWDHDTINVATFEYFVDGKPRADLPYQEVGPSSIPGKMLFQARLPTDLQAGDHSFQVRACNSKAVCSGFLIVPFMLKADGTITPPATPSGGTVIQVTVSVTVKP